MRACISPSPLHVSLPSCYSYSLAYLLRTSWRRAPAALTPASHPRACHSFSTAYRAEAFKPDAQSETQRSVRDACTGRPIPELLPTGARVEVFNERRTRERLTRAADPAAGPFVPTGETCTRMARAIFCDASHLWIRAVDLVPL
eukprot:scaffold60761_cov58-Phaeocystis_antarctica.AAC.7